MGEVIKRVEQEEELTIEQRNEMKENLSEVIDSEKFVVITAKIDDEEMELGTAASNVNEKDIIFMVINIIQTLSPMGRIVATSMLQEKLDSDIVEVESKEDTPEE